MSSSTTAGRARLLGLAAVIVLAGLALDQVSKAWAIANLDVPRPIIGELLQFRLLYNPGAAFSIGESVTWLYTAVAAAVSVGILLVLPRVRNLWWLVTLSVLLAGALGNLADRLFRPPSFGHGHVIDFIDYGPFVGNVADIWIVGAAVVLVVLNLRGVPADGRPAPAAEPQDVEEER